MVGDVDTVDYLDSLTFVLQQKRLSVVLTGRPGSGKTISLQQFVRRLMGEESRKIMPLYVNFSTMRGAYEFPAGQYPGIYGILSKGLKSQGMDRTAGEIRKDIETGRFLLVLDHVSEVADYLRRPSLKGDFGASYQFEIRELGHLLCGETDNTNKKQKIIVSMEDWLLKCLMPLWQSDICPNEDFNILVSQPPEPEEFKEKRRKYLKRKQIELSRYAPHGRRLNHIRQEINRFQQKDELHQAKQEALETIANFLVEGASSKDAGLWR
ncbi:MAG: ATP-binding protein [Nanoarchaeota archaeon]|nr:ATP-binding protein [Nanoarchaeota archaeon]MBU4086517.1 ATP-binding protein [Nanoarchaeota archaeon]